MQTTPANSPTFSACKPLLARPCYTHDSLFHDSISPDPLLSLHATASGSKTPTPHKQNRNLILFLSCFSVGHSRFRLHTKNIQSKALIPNADSPPVILPVSPSFPLLQPTVSDRNSPEPQFCFQAPSPKTSRLLQPLLFRVFSSMGEAIACEDKAGSTPDTVRKTQITSVG